MKKKVLVTGGTGKLGKWVVAFAKEKYDVRVLSTRNEASLPAGVSLVRGDLSSETGLGKAVAGADIIVHCASNPRSFQQVDEEGTKNLLRSVEPKKTRHLVFISIVGIDQSSFPYYQAKYEVEKIIAESGIPYTILRATQFHDLVLNMVQSFVRESEGDFVKIPAGMKFQSIAIQEVARVLVDSLEAPAGRLSDMGGPEVLSFESMVKTYLNFTKTTVPIRSVAMEGGLYDVFRSGVNLCPDHAKAEQTWKSFLEEMTEIE